MSTVVTRLSAVGTKLQVGAAACAIAGAAVLTPAVAAQADIATVPVPAAPAFSDFMNSPVVTEFMTSPVLDSASYATEAGWWFWGPGPGDDGPTTFFEFQPINLVPTFLKPLYTWWTSVWDFSTCVFGITFSIGPYGTTRLGYSRGC